MTNWQEKWDAVIGFIKIPINFIRVIKKTGYEPEFSCHTLENYISLTKLELFYLPVRKFRDNISKKERLSIKNLKRNKQLIIKKADKNGNVVVLDKDNDLSEGYRQLNMPHYEQIENHNLENLQTELNKYINNIIYTSLL